MPAPLPDAIVPLPSMAGYDALPGAVPAPVRSLRPAPRMWRISHRFCSGLPSLDLFDALGRAEGVTGCAAR